MSWHNKKLGKFLGKRDRETETAEYKGQQFTAGADGADGGKTGKTRTCSQAPG